MQNLEKTNRIIGIGKKKHNASTFDIINISILVLFSIAAFYPFYNVYVYAFNDGSDSLKGLLYLWPRKFSVQNFVLAFTQKGIYTSILVSVARTVIGTVLTLVCTSSFAYAMTKRRMPGYKFVSVYIFITYLFGGGFVPYFLTVRELGLYNTFWIFILPGIYSFWNMIIFRSFFATLPNGIEEAAKIDGASYMRVFRSIIIPLSKPVYAAIALLTAIGLWNDYFTGMFFVSATSPLVPLQTLLQRLMTEVEILSTSIFKGGNMEKLMSNITPYSVRLAVVVISVTPIILVYPFLQKYIIKGVTIGAIKG